MYPKSKSPLETKYERLRGMCGGAWENVRYIPIDNGMQQHGGHGGSRVWQGMAVYGCCCVYIGIMIAWRKGRAEARDTDATMCILVYDMRTQYTTAIPRASQRPGACIACACVRALYYYIIIILLYYYIIIFIYTQYIQYTKYT